MIYFELKNSKALLTEGQNLKVEAYKTVLCRRDIIIDLTSSEDDIKDIIWILGIIDIANNNFYMTRIKDRTIHTISETFEGRIGVSSVLGSDIFPIYTAVARNFSLKHIWLIILKGLSLRTTHILTI
ncbi:hypothetical protein NGRA_2766 [Nosema granulosis]|uniref:Uncharacterized protein n=1 Tax=Nosema granulosis TaxID=83296 RepID=A0A9P6GWH2_9MICR|nr:hypothetical protein NGRA_2766 [Nosema granulosis]